jgi:DedD protein
MTDSLHDRPETSVDALRRRARRRLLGAVVLAIGAAIAMPLIFEKEPPPLPNEVDIRIPPVDKTPFDPKTVASGKASVAPATPVTPAPAAPVAPAPPPVAIAEIKPEPLKAETKGTAEPPKAITPAPEKKAEEKKAAPEKTETANADPDGPKTEPKAGDYVVQLIAVRDQSSAMKVLEQARGHGYKSAYREVIDVSNGKVTRVRTGPYKDKAFAEKTRNALEAKGFEAVVVQIK